MFDHFPGIAWPTPYGVMLALAGASAWWFARRRACGCGLDPSHVDLVLPLAFASGAGANMLIAAGVPQERLLAGQASLAEELLRMPLLILVALPVLFAYCRIADISARRLADVVVPAALVAVAIGYFGCFLAGCCFGALRLQPARRGPGTLALATFAGYAVLAFGLQFLRADGALVLGPLTATQFIYLAWLATVPPLAVFARSRSSAAGGG